MAVQASLVLGAACRCAGSGPLQSAWCHDVRRYLPAKVQQVIFCKMSKLQHTLYQGFLASEAVSGGRRLAHLGQQAASRLAWGP